MANCNRQQLNITCGTDVVLHDRLIFDGETFDPNLSVGITANLVSSLGKRTALDVQVIDDELLISVPWIDGTLPGCYGLEVTGSCNSKKWATYADSLIKYTKATRIGVSEVTVESDSYDITQEVGYCYSNSPVTFAEVTVDDGYGTPSVDVEYEHRELSMAFHNLKGNGITDIDVDEQEGDEAVNTVTIKTDADQEGTEFHVRNGRRGNGIASSSEELSDQDGGINTFAFTDDDGNVHEFHSKNGTKGSPGDSAVYDPSSPDAPDFVMANTTGQSTTKAMTQKAVTDALTGMVVNNLVDGGALLALSAEMGKLLRSRIQEVYTRLQNVYDAIGNIAFWDGKPAKSTILPPIDWGSDKVALYLNFTNCSAPDALTTITLGGSATIVVYADSGYRMPANLLSSAVTEATLSSYVRSADKMSATIFITDVDGNVSIALDGIDVPYEEPSDGELLFWLDGKEATTSTWVDKIGGIVFNNVNGTLVTDGGNPNGLSFNGTDARMYTGEELSFLPAESTIEIVCKPVSVTYYYYNYILAAGGMTTEDPSLKCIHAILYKNGNTAYMNGVYIDGTGTLNQDGTWVGGHVWNMPFTLNQNLVIGANKTCAVNNGASMSSLGANHWTSLYDNDTIKAEISSVVNNLGNFKSSQGVIYAIRIYRGQLTAAQMLQNQIIDNARYNLGLTLPNSL